MADDPVQKDVKIIEDAAADLGQADELNMADAQKLAALDEEQRRLDAQRAAAAADLSAQRTREAADETKINDANADARRQTGTVPGPGVPPQPPRPRVG